MTTAQMVARGRASFKQIDLVWLVFFTGLAIVFLIDRDQGLSSAKKIAESLLFIIPFLMVAAGAAGYVAATKADHLISEAFSKRIVFSIILASLFGALSPFCSCGVIPLIAALLAMGVPLAPVMAFWLASPIMDPGMFMIMAGELGLAFSIGKTIAAVAIGLLGGFGVWALSSSGLMTNPLRPGIGNAGCGGQSVRDPSDIRWAFWHDQDRREVFGSNFKKSAFFLIKWLCLAYLMESLFVAYIPGEFFAQYLGSGEGLMIVMAAIIGAPLYLNGYAAVPLAAGLMENGMAPGAAMAFLIGGGVTSIPAAMAVFALAKKRVFALYVFFGITGASIAGIGFQAFAG
ncbi:MAG: permease [Cohaesibacteraceae bacterium]|nr:permease [Cohaesibacteraceae bacterium]